jgi:hypothetical protein
MNIEKMMSLLLVLSSLLTLYLVWQVLRHVKAERYTPRPKTTRCPYMPLRPAIDMRPNGC